jgi:vacuolar-type H+-ATPase subunit E/Vma4
MAIESLLDALGSDTERDAQQVVDAAHAEAARIRAAAEARVAERCSAALAAHEAQLCRATDARRAAAMREARAEALRARDEFLERVFTSVERQLTGMLDTPAHSAALTRLVREGLRYVASNAVVRCRESLANRLRTDASALGAARIVVDAAVREGVVIVAEDGSVTIDNTLENRLRWLRPVLGVEVLAQFERGT